MPDLNEPAEVVVLYPGPTFDVAPFPLIRVEKQDVPAYLAQGWVTEPVTEETKKPAKKK